MNNQEFREYVQSKSPVLNFEKELLLSGIALPDEAGEVAGLIKKWYFHNHPLDLEKYKDELADCLNYIVRAGLNLGIGVEELYEINKAKLDKRYPNGFNPEDSINRTV